MNIKTVFSQKIEIKGYKGIFIRGIFVLKNNRLILTTVRNGFIIIENGLAKTINIRNFLNANNVYSILENPDGSLFVGTEDGLYKYENDRYEKAYLNNNKIDKRVFFVIRDNSNDIWIGTDAGIIRFNGINLWHYGVKEGLSGLETNRAAAIISSTGKLLIGTNRGLSIYRKEYDINRNILPITQLLGIEIRGNSYPVDSTLNLSYDDNNIIFNFNVVSFYDEKNNSIMYKLEGFDGDWIESYNLENFFKTYNNLPPGDYIFRLKAKNALGIWGQEVRSGKITIDTPYYYSLWFILIIIIMLIALIGAYIRVSTNKKYRNRLEKEVNDRTLQLENSQKRYKQMFEDNNAIMLIINPENAKIEDANPSAMKFYSLNKSEFIDKTLFDFIAQNEQLDNQIILNSLLHDREFEISQFINSFNSIRQLKIHLSKIENLNHKSVFCIIDDITEQKLAANQLVKFNEELEIRVQERTIDLEQALKTLNDEIDNRNQAERELIDAKEELELSLDREKELSRLKSRFISMVSHEYRTPLTVIFSSAELIKEFAKISKPEACSDYAKRIQDSVKTLTGLLEGVMAIGEDTVINVFKEKFSFNDFIKYLAETFSASIKDSHKIIVNYQNENHIISQDKNLIWQIANQILSNAVKFSEKNTEIIINYDITDTNLKLSIKDNGKGIALVEQELIFEPFFRSADTIGIISGTGLGLTIARKNLQALSGDIYVESILGQGATFYINIPLN